MRVIDETNQNFAAAYMDLLKWNFKFGHIIFQNVLYLAGTNHVKVQQNSKSVVNYTMLTYDITG